MEKMVTRVLSFLFFLIFFVSFSWEKKFSSPKDVYSQLQSSDPTTSETSEVIPKFIPPSPKKHSFWWKEKQKEDRQIIFVVTQTMWDGLLADVDTFYLITMGALVFLMQLGFILLEAGFPFRQLFSSSLFSLSSFLIPLFLDSQFAFSLGMVRSKNIVNLLFKNIMDVCIGCFAWYIFGFAFSNGEGNRFIGYEYFALKDVDEVSFFLFFFNDLKKVIFFSNKKLIDFFFQAGRRCHFCCLVLFFHFCCHCFHYCLWCHGWEDSIGWIFDFHFCLCLVYLSCGCSLALVPARMARCLFERQTNFRFWVSFFFLFFFSFFFCFVLFFEDFFKKIVL